MSTTSAITRTAAIATASALALLIGLALIGAHVSNAKYEAPAANVAKAPAPVQTAAPVAEVPDLQGRPLAIAFNTYMVDVGAQLFAADVSTQMDLSRIQQAVQFSNLDAYKKAAEDFEETLRNTQSAVLKSPRPENLSDADADMFDSVFEAANDYLGARLEVAADIGVNAHTGMDTGSLAADVKASNKARAHYRDVVLKAYKRLGVPKADINPDTLTLKSA